MGRALEPCAWASVCSGGAASLWVWTGCGCRLAVRGAGRGESWAEGAPGAEVDECPGDLEVDEGLFPIFSA